MNHLLRTIKKICAIALPAFIIGSVVMNAGCNKKFDSPPLESTDTPVVTMTIKELKAMHTTKGSVDIINTKGVISGIVTANDNSGNLYYTGTPGNLVIQDTSGAVFIKIQANNIYSDYPIGRKIYVSVKGLSLGDYSGTIQLGYGTYTGGSSPSVDGILPAIADSFITRGSFGNTVIPAHITNVTDLNADASMQNPMIGQLITIDGLEFPDNMLDSTYADTTKTKSNRTINLENCAGETITLFTSSYATFAGVKVPQGRGNITGIYTNYNSTREIIIRDTFDVQFYGPRCNGGVTSTSDTISISDVRKIGNGTIPANSIIKGIIISNFANEAAGNYRLEAEDGSAGVILYFSTTPNPALTVGQEISVNVGGLTVAPFNGDLEIGKVPAATIMGTGSVTPRTATIADIKKNMNDWASTLVTIKDVTIKEGTASGNGINDTISDATGSLVTYIRNAANIIPPAQASGITGYVSVYQPSGGTAVAQLGLRDQNDIVASTAPPATGSDFTATYDFSSVATTTGTTDPTTPPAVSNVTFGSFSAVGVSSNPTAGGRFSFTGWPLGATNGVDNFTGAINTGQYFEVTITPTSGHSIDLSGITFTFQRSGTGVRQASVRSSLDNFTDNLPASIDPANANLSVVSTNIIQITDAATTAQDGSTITLGSDFSNITSAVTFRFYGFNAEANGGSFSIDNVVFSGTVH